MELGDQNNEIGHSPMVWVRVQQTFYVKLYKPSDKTRILYNTINTIKIK